MKDQSKTKQVLIQELASLRQRIAELEQPEFGKRQAEDALHLFKDLVDHSSDAIGMSTPEGIHYYQNESFDRLFGDIGDLPIETVYVDKAIGKQVFDTIMSGGSWQGEVKMFKKDRTILDIFQRAYAILNQDGRIIGLVGLHTDITERKRSVQALRESENRYRELFDNMGSGVSVYETRNNGEDFIFKEYNAAAEKLDKTPREQAIGRSVVDVFPGVKDFGLFDVFQQVYRTGKPERHPITFYKDEKINGWRENYVYKLPSGEIVSVFEDITERKQAEEKVKASLREKNILLSEIHHRVKNNMQVISGLLDLQARTSGNLQLTEMVNESQSRIRSMALIHEKLYDSNNFTGIELAGYVQTLSQELFQSYSVDPGKIALIIQTDGAVYVDINTAIPCGLILNELISNALKHAFRGARSGEIKIIIGETKNNEIEIIIRDNGAGLPDHVDIHQPRSMGLHLVKGLVKNQLDGQIEVRRDAGTEFWIKFPL